MTRSMQALKTDALFHLSRGLNRSFTPPDWVSINLTLKCNLHCTMCNTCYDVPQELTRQEIFDLIDQIALWGVHILNPLGGEPFVRPDLIEILQYAVLKDFYITLTTNGTLITREHAEGIARIAYDRLHFNFSIDGFAEVHDRIRGNGMLERTLEGIRHIREADAAAGNPPRKLLINSVVNNLNLDHVPAFLEYCRGLGVQGVQLLNLFKKGGPEIPRELKHLWIGRERWAALDRMVDEVLEYKEGLDPQQFMVVNSRHELEIMKLYYRGTLPPRKAKCYAGWKELYINADGQVIMCDGELDFLKGAFGNIRQNTLQELWESDALRQRREVVKACTSPCIQDCYLRESSDSMLNIVKEVGQKVVAELKKRVPLKPSRWVHVPDSELTLELSDVADLNPPHQTSRSAERFSQLIIKSPVPFERCYADPFEFYDMRNRGYLNFNRGFMGLEVIQKFMPELARAGVKLERIRLAGKGDPLLHPEFNLVLRYLLEQGASTGSFGELRIETSATLLNTEYVDISMTEARGLPITWMLLLDAADASTFEQVQGQARFETVCDRVAYLLAMKARHQASHVRIVPVFTALPENAVQAQAFQTFWNRRFREEGLPEPRLAFSTLPPHVPGQPLEDVLLYRRKDNDTFLEQLKSKEAFQTVAQALGFSDVVLDRDQGRLPRCAAPFKTPTITWDGKVTVCEQDRFLKLKVGEVLTEELVTLWWQKNTAQELRRAVSRGELHQRLPCRDCRQPFSPNAPTLSDEELSRFKRQSVLQGFGV